MIEIKDKSGQVKRKYDANTGVCVHLCFANIECLLKIALMDSDEHIRQMGGESKIIDLIHGYMIIAEELKKFEGKYPTCVETMGKMSIEDYELMREVDNYMDHIKEAVK